MHARRLLLVLSVALVSCTAQSDKSTAERLQKAHPAALISDQTHSGRLGFAWEPPMVPAYDPTPGFRTDVKPVVQIDQIDPLNGNAFVQHMVTYTMSTLTGEDKDDGAKRCCSDGQEHIRIHAQGDKDDDGDAENNAYYSVRWRTAKYPELLPPPAAYRITVLVDGLVLGFADTEFAEGKKALKKIDTQQYVAMLDDATVRINFRIDTPAIDYDRDGILDSKDNCWKVANPDQADADHDGKGDACDPCPDEAIDDVDGDHLCAGPRFLASITDFDGVVTQTGLIGASDNCPGVYNATQTDTDQNGVGDACQPQAQGAVAAGGTVTVTDPTSVIFGATVSLPPDSPVASATFSIAAMAAADLPPASSAPVGPVLDIQGPVGGVYDPPLVVGVPYTPAAIGSIPPENLVVYHYLQATGEYELLAIHAVDTVQHVVFVQSHTLSPFFVGTPSVELTSPSPGWYLASGSYNLDVSTPTIGLSGQIGVPAGKTPTLIVTNQTNATTTTPIQSPAACDPGFTDPACKAWTTTVALVTGQNTIRLRAAVAGVAPNIIVVYVNKKTCSDADKDGYYTCPAGDPGIPPIGSLEADGVTVVKGGGDCNDNSAAINPGAAEICDGKDNNCDGRIDEGFPDFDHDSIADCRDPDQDNDGILNALDTCPFDAQNDKDGDGWCNGPKSSVYGATFLSPKLGAGDNCVSVANATQSDVDNDGVGDACDNCPFVANANQLDTGNTGTGDVCRWAPAPTRLAAAGGTSQVALSWKIGKGWDTTGLDVMRSLSAAGPWTLATSLAGTATAYTDTGLSAGTVFFYELIAKNTLGNGETSVVVSDITAPAAPTNLSAVALGTTATLTWDAMAGAASYTIYRGTTSGAWSLFGTSATSSATDNTGAPGDTLYYVVTATNPSGTSQSSNEASTTLVPPTAAGLTATQNQGTVVLGWPSSKGARSYFVSRSTTPGGPYIQLADVAGNSYVDAAVSAGGTYAYVIQAANGAGNKGYSNEASTTLTPAAPTGLTATTTDQTITLGWTAPFGATSFNVLRGTTAGGPYAVVAGTTTAPTATFADGPLANGTTYFYVVTATNTNAGVTDPSGGGTGPQSNQASAITVLPPPTALAVAQSGVGSLTVTWSAVPEATSFTVARSSDGVAFTDLAPDSSGPSFTDAALLNGTTYFYRVVAHTSSTSSLASASASGVTVLPAPTNPQATVSTFDINVTWTATADATSYDVQRSLTATGGFSTIAAGVTATSFCNCGNTSAMRTPNTTYYYQVIANTAAASSVPSAVVSATTVFPAPTGLAIASSGRTTLVATWIAVAGASNYSLQRSLFAAGPFTEIQQLSAPTATDTGLAYATTYYYQVLALSPSGASPASLVASATTQANPWQPGAGLYGGEVTSLVFDPANPLVAYAGVRGAAGLFKSTDAGATWAASGNRLGASSIGPVASLAIAGGKVFAGTLGAGLFASADGGQGWTSAAGLPADALVSLAADPANGTMYAATAKAIFASVDGGSTWTATTFAATAPVTSLAVDPNDAAIVYAATDGAGLFKTQDNATTWAPSGLAAESLQGGLAIDPANSLRVWAGSAAGVQASVDGGATWALTASPKRILSLAFAGGTLYAGSNGAGVSSSQDGGTTWTLIPGASAAVGGIVALAAAGNRLLASGYSGAGVYASTGGGAFGISNSGLGAADLTALAISPSNPAILYAVAGYGLSKSVDHGATWTGTSLAYPVVATALAVDPTNANIAYVGAGGVRRTTDGGAPWSTSGANFVPSGLAISAAAPSTVYAAVYNGGVYTGTFPAGTWTQTSSGITDPHVRAVAADPANAQNVYAGGDGGFFRSVNGGANWTASGLTFVRSITVAAGVVFAVTGDGTASMLQRSLDGGATFTAVGFGTAGVQNLVSIAVDPVNAQTLYAAGNASNGSGGGLFKSLDGGATWAQVQAGLTTSRLRKLLIDPVAPGSLFLATQDSGLFLTSTAGQ